MESFLSVFPISTLSASVVDRWTESTACFLHFYARSSSDAEMDSDWQQRGPGIPPGEDVKDVLDDTLDEDMVDE